jgi:hypothetical protein
MNIFSIAYTIFVVEKRATNGTGFFIGNNAGDSAVNAEFSNFLGHSAGGGAASASYSNLIGFQVGVKIGSSPGIGKNNTIIGSNITLENGRQDSINIGGLIFGTGSYSTLVGNPFSGSANGRIGINQPLPVFNLDVSGSGRYTNGLTVTGSLIAPNITGSLQGTASWALNAITSSYILNAVSSSFASTASSADNFIVRNSITASSALITGTLTAQTLVVQTVSSSIIYSSGSNVFGNSLSNTQVFTGSVSITGSLSVNGSSAITSNQTSSMSVLSSSFATTASYVLNAVSASFATSSSFAVSASFAPSTNIYTTDGSLTSARTLTLNSQPLTIAGTTSTRFFANGNIGIGTTTDAGYKLDVNGTTRFVGNSLITGNLNVTSAITASQALISGSGTQRLIVVGSGSAQPIFTVQGSQGELFSITDSLSGSLFSVNDISGLPILETFSDSTTLLGSYLAPALFTTKKTTTTNSGSFVIYNIPTGSYDGLYVDYTARSGSNARAGQIIAIWSGSSVNFTETTTTDFGTTSNLLLGVSISGSSMALTGSVATGSGWVIKSIIRSI